MQHHCATPFSELQAYFPPTHFAETGAAVLIESAQGGCYAAVSGAQTANGTNICQWSYVKQANLEWFIKPAEEAGYFYLVSALDPYADRVMALYGEAHDNGANVCLWQRVRQGNCMVRFQDCGGGAYNILWKHSNKGLAVYGAVRDNNANICQWDAVDQPNLKWKFALAPKTPFDFVDKPINVAIESGVAGGWYMAVYGASTQDNTNVCVWSWADQPNLKWRLKSSETAGQFYVTTAIDTSRDITIALYGESHDNGANVCMWHRVNQQNCQVKFEDAGYGFWRMHFAHSRKCVHLHGGQGHNDANVTQWEPLSQPNLVWRFRHLWK